MQKISIALLSLAACFSSTALAAHRGPMDIVKRGLPHGVHLDKRGHKHNDPFKNFEYYNRKTARMFLTTGILELATDIMLRTGSVLGQWNSYP